MKNKREGNIAIFASRYKGAVMDSVFKQLIYTFMSAPDVKAARGFGIARFRQSSLVESNWL